MNKKPIVFLMGATGCGKTDIAIEMCERYPCEVISVDSALIYRGLDIGTAKPSAQICARIPHHLINILDPAQSYSAALFREDTLRCIEDIHSRDKLPMLVGGTMFYFNALTEGLDQMPEVRESIVHRIDKIERQRGLPYLYKLLSRVDHLSSQRLHQNDCQRIKRALGVYFACGQPLSKLQTGATQGMDFPYQVHRFVVNYRTRATLHQRLLERLNQMLSNGLLQETMGLMLRSDIPSSAPVWRLIGYAQMCAYLSGKLSFEDMRHRVLFATRQLAKRQLTWLRGMPQAHQFYLDEQSMIEVNEILGEKIAAILATCRSI